MFLGMVGEYVPVATLQVEGTQYTPTLDDALYFDGWVQHYPKCLYKV